MSVHSGYTRDGTCLEISEMFALLRLLLPYTYIYIIIYNYIYTQYIYISLSDILSNLSRSLFLVATRTLQLLSHEEDLRLGRLVITGIQMLLPQTRKQDLLTGEFTKYNMQKMVYRTH